MVFAHKCFSFVCASPKKTLTAFKAGTVITTSCSQKYLLHKFYSNNCPLFCTVTSLFLLCYPGFPTSFCVYFKGKKKNNRHYANYHISQFEVLQQQHEFSMSASCFPGNHSFSSSFKTLLPVSAFLMVKFSKPFL